MRKSIAKKHPFQRKQNAHKSHLRSTELLAFMGIAGQLQLFAILFFLFPMQLQDGLSKLAVYNQHIDQASL